LKFALHLPAGGRAAAGGIFMSERSNLSKNGSEARGGRLRAIGMVRLAVVTAIIILMAFTPIGYLKYGPLSITFLQIPVVVGAIVLGPASGAFLGGVFGATSLAQCFGLDAFGTMLFGLNPVGTIILNSYTFEADGIKYFSFYRE